MVTWVQYLWGSERSQQAEIETQTKQTTTTWSQYLWGSEDFPGIEDVSPQTQRARYDLLRQIKSGAATLKPVKVQPPENVWIIAKGRRNKFRRTVLPKPIL